MEETKFYHALKIDNDRCVGCTHCMTKCPTGAIRIREGKASIRKGWCVDCGECLKACPTEAIYVEQDDFQKIFDYKARVVRTGVYACVPGRVYGRHDPSRDAQADGAGGG